MAIKLKKGVNPMSKMCPVCEVKQKGLCIHEKIMLGMMGVIAVAVVLVVVI
jgi:hypothetical protein